ncbi:MAG: sensor histidine kinase, partial [Candidatus Hodarchaeota archaeon]
EKGIEIEYEKALFKVLGGPLLEEAFHNLIENSIKHARCKKIKISSHEEDEKIIITLEDDGKGVPKEIQDKLSDKEYKTERSTSLGSGTYLIKRIVENYGGNITYRSSVFGGARFDVTLNKTT